MDRTKWLERSARTSYRFMRVSRATGLETERLVMLKGGSITRNNDVRVFETAEVEAVGTVDLGPDLVRVYMETEWPDGTTETTVLGTFLPTVPSRGITDQYSKASMKLTGRLQELLDDKFSVPVVYQKGTNAVKAAADICRQQGLSVIADDSDFTITNPRSYGVGVQQNNSETGDTKLDAVNDLLALADFQAAKTDERGNVIMRKYVRPDERPEVWTFTEGSSATFEADMKEERDISKTANHVVVVYQNEESTFLGEAYDTDPTSELSTVSRGRTITKTYSYTELPPGKTDSERQQYANARAERLLKSDQSVIRKVFMRYAYAPITATDAVILDYPSGGIGGKFEVRTQRLKLSGGCPCESELRRFER